MPDEQTKQAVHAPAGSPAAVKEHPKASEKKKPKKLPPYHVVLLNDDDHSFEYVVEMLGSLFGYPDHKGFQLADEVDRTGRVIVCTTHREHAELKRDQIHAFGKDERIASCAGAMSAIIEPAPEA